MIIPQRSLKFLSRDSLVFLKEMSLGCSSGVSLLFFKSLMSQAFQVSYVSLKLLLRVFSGVFGLLEMPFRSQVCHW